MAEPARTVWKRIAIYVGLVFLFSSPFYAIVLGVGRLVRGAGCTSPG